MKTRTLDSRGPQKNGKRDLWFQYEEASFRTKNKHVYNRTEGFPYWTTAEF